MFWKWPIPHNPILGYVVLMWLIVSGSRRRRYCNVIWLYQKNCILKEFPCYLALWVYLAPCILVIIGLGKGFSLVWHQAIAWTNVHSLSIGPLGINFREIINQHMKLSFPKIYSNMSSATWRHFVQTLLRKDTISMVYIVTLYTSNKWWFIFIIYFLRTYIKSK